MREGERERERERERDKGPGFFSLIGRRRELNINRMWGIYQ